MGIYKFLGNSWGKLNAQGKKKEETISSSNSDSHPYLRFLCIFYCRVFLLCHYA